jgi:hypothetical protein
VQHVEDSSAVPHQFIGQLLDAAVHYAETWRWDVLPGAWLEGGVTSAPRCSCGSRICPAPGAHPTRPDWAARASGAAPALRQMWQEQPRSSVLLLTGRTFDAIDVSEEAGCLALARAERMGLPLGPVLGTPRRRMQFFVLPGAGAKVPDLLRRMRWAPWPMDLAVLGEGAWVVAPPTRTVPGGCAQWARPPTPVNRWLPDAYDLIGALAYACTREVIEAREAAGARQAEGVPEAADTPGTAAAVAR